MAASIPYWLPYLTGGHGQDRVAAAPFRRQERGAFCFGPTVYSAAPLYTRHAEFAPLANRFHLSDVLSENPSRSWYECGSQTSLGGFCKLTER